MRMTESRCTAAVWLLHDVQVDAVHETSYLVLGENEPRFRPSNMRPSSDDVHHRMDESSARFHSKRGRSCGLRQPERRIKAKRLQYNAIQPSSSGEIDLRISYSCTFI
ncbi:unnamed protein product [Protopolystoma xenopodis]|uniref:Uncharacterized protein n=1 Tax=Protopolystoma xenopodis TaxID=117903 RepID=A0A3S4ZTN6_9PLAT|nr:unnamed protein product [Protopolystoma xenopodis]